MKYPIVDFVNAIYCHSSFGPCFGNINEFCIYDNSNTNTCSFVRANAQYKVPTGANGNHSILTDGNANF